MWIRAMSTCGQGLGLSIIAGMITWGILAIYYSNLFAWLRPILAALFGMSAIVMLAGIHPFGRGLLAFLIMFAILLIWWLSIPPSNDRKWHPGMAVLPNAALEGNKITIYNIRNCDYRTETDFDVRYYDRTYNIHELQTIDLFMVYWGSSLIAHTMLSFGFGKDEYICFSIETRKKEGDDYSAIKGFLKQYELTYVVADERDVVRLRTNYRQVEEVYLYRLKASPEVARKVLLDYLKRIRSLRVRPEWYNALTSNCTSNIHGHTQPYAGGSWWSWKLILNGYVDELAYDNGALDRSLPFAELKALSHINARAQAAEKDPAFSRRIREGLPGF